MTPRGLRPDQSPRETGDPSELADHALLTRFNLPTSGVEGRIRAQDDWLLRRVSLFESYCLPSVAAQTADHFSWLVYFDPASPAWLRERIDKWQMSSPMTALMRTEVPHDVLLDDLTSVTGKRRSHLLTTNLDNDDALARDLLERLQTVRAPARTAIFCPEGVVASDSRLYARVDRRNAFCSVREPWHGAVTCWADWHNLLERHMPVIELTGGAGWMQVIHGQNVSNRVRGSLRPPDRYRDAFPGLVDDFPTLDKRTARVDRWLLQPVRTCRDVIRATVRTIALRVLGKPLFDRAKSRVAQLRDVVAGRHAT